MIVRNATLAYEGKVVFSNLTLDIKPGRFTVLLGSSGVGKSSLLRLLAGLTPHKQPNLPQHIAYMAQTDLLLPWLNVIDNALLGLTLRNTPKIQLAQAKEKAKALLAQVGLERAIALYPKQLSGGMRQRVALVRTLIEDKPIVLMDEPFSALDTVNRYKLQTLTAQLLHNTTVIMITHDPMEALRLAHDIYIMQDQPATLHLAASLISSTPRQLTDADVIKHQVSLFDQLNTAFKESV